MTLTERLHALLSSLLRELPRFVLIGLFAFAAVDQVIHFRGFVAAIHNLQLLPSRSESFTATFFIMAEFAIAFGLLTSRWRRPACLSAVLLLGTLTVVYLTIDRGQVCGTWFTLTLNSGGYFYILHNLVFIALAVVTWTDHKSVKTDPSDPTLTSTSTAESDDGRLKHA